MKKLIVLFLLMSMMLPQLSLAADPAQAVHPGETILTDFLEMTVNRAEVRPSLIGSGGSGRTLNPSEKSQYYCVWGTLTNTGFSDLKLGNMYAEMIFNDKYRYKTDIFVDYEGALQESLEPLCDSDLVIAAKIPNKLVDLMETCAVELVFSEETSYACNSVESGDYHYLISFNEESMEQAKEGPVREQSFFDECPALPLPQCFMDANEVSSYRNTVGKRANSVKYTYSLTGNPKNANEIYRTYIDGITAEYGIDCYAESGEYKAVLNGKTIAYINCDSMFLEITIVPGNEHLQPVKGTGIVSDEAAPNQKVSIGQKLKAKSCTFRLIETGESRILYSYISGKQPNRWEYVETQSGIYVYLLGELGNTGNHEIDPRNIYVEVVVDDKHYDGFAKGVGEKQKNFINNLPAGFSTKVYLAAEVQPVILNNAKSVIIRFGFTEDFNIKYKKDGVPDFTYCTDVYEYRIR